MFEPRSCPPAGRPTPTLSFSQAGTYVVVLETNRATSELPAIRFNDYIKAEGIAPAIAARPSPARPIRRAASSTAAGPRRSSAIGNVTTPQPQVTRPVGLTARDRSGRDPTGADFDMTLPVTILYQGRPLAGRVRQAQQSRFRRPPGRHGDQRRPWHRSVHQVPFKGLWQLNVVWTTPIKDPKADFDTVFLQPDVRLESRAAAVAH